MPSTLLFPLFAVALATRIAAVIYRASAELGEVP
jgi:hypothetical protein